MSAVFPVPRRRLVVSIVSHGHGAMLSALLAQLAQRCSGSVMRVVVTQNLPEPPPTAPLAGWPFDLQMVVNDQPRGFGANHNQALAGASEEFVCVLNPDVVLGASDPFATLVAAAAVPRAGCAYPVQVDHRGHRQDSERELPSPSALMRRRLLGRQESRVDWVNAACLVIPTEVWRALGGFDERYFMYCEDVDLCLRMRAMGLQLVRAPALIIHAGQRASSRRLTHLAWHVRSLIRLWRSPAYRTAQQLLTSRSGGAGTIGSP